LNKIGTMNKEETIANIKLQCDELIAYLQNKGNKEMHDVVAVIEETCQKKNINGLKIIHSDLMEWAKSLSPHPKEINEKLLALDNKRLEKVKEILERGIIQGEEEFRLLSSHLDENFNQMETQIISRTNALLAAFLTFNND